MPEDAQNPIDVDQIRKLLNERRGRMKMCLAACAGCTLCAESCFMFMSKGQDPKYMPAYKVLNSLGKLYKKRGKVTRAQLEEMKDIAWKNCVLCGRCQCPLGIDLPNMMAFTRSILRSQGVDGAYLHSLDEPDGDNCQGEPAERPSETEEAE